MRAIFASFVFILYDLLCFDVLMKLNLKFAPLWEISEQTQDELDDFKAWFGLRTLNTNVCERFLTLFKVES